MKRLTVLAVALALVGSAQAGGYTSRAANAAASCLTGPSLDAIAAYRQCRAGRTAQRLLRRVVLPAAARRVSEQTGDSVLGGVNLGGSHLAQFEWRHVYWQLPGTFKSVVAFLKRHPPPGFRFAGVGNAGTFPFQGVDFEGRTVGGHFVTSQVRVSLVRFRGGTAARVDAGVAWIYPRSPTEVVPAGVRSIGIRSTHVWRVTDPAKVAQIIRWFDGLYALQPNTTGFCPYIKIMPVGFVFRSSTGTQLASATVPNELSYGCDPIQFTIGAAPQDELVDSTPLNGHSFAQRVAHLLGIYCPPSDLALCYRHHS